MQRRGLDSTVLSASVAGIKNKNKKEGNEPTVAKSSLLQSMQSEVSRCVASEARQCRPTRWKFLLLGEVLHKVAGAGLLDSPPYATTHRYLGANRDAMSTHKRRRLKKRQKRKSRAYFWRVLALESIRGDTSPCLRNE
ncbi:MAG: hypothetical protein U1C12_01635 [Patescibacteria group bacterium]|nr:hypothetical protein [Patescibacteria group bacterium]